MGSADRIIRITIAIMLTVLFYNGIISGTWGIILIVLSSVFVLTSLVGFCPLYSVLGISSCKVEKQIK